MTRGPVERRSVPFGDYRLREKLGQGGMAEILLAERAGAKPGDPPVVIKRVLPSLCELDDFALMFLDEARIAARIDHPGVARIFDLGEVGGQYYLAMEFVPGEDQLAVFQQAKKKSLPLPFEYAAEVAIGAAEALAFAHQMKDGEGRLLNVVHRDVSPSNLVFTWEGGVKLLDFGIARAETNAVKTRGGSVKGKVRYLSPEQCRGGRADLRSDLYSLGVVLYELLTASRLFVRDSPMLTVDAIRRGEVPPLGGLRAEVPRELESVVRRAMAVDPDQRYQSGSELAADLSIYLTHTPWVRGAHGVEFLTAVFGEERRAAKLKAARGERLTPAEAEAIGATPVGRTPSGERPAATARHTPSGERPAVRLPELMEPDPDEPRTAPSSAPRGVRRPDGAAEPTSARGTELEMKPLGSSPPPATSVTTQPAAQVPEDLVARQGIIDGQDRKTLPVGVPGEPPQPRAQPIDAPATVRTEALARYPALPAAATDFDASTDPAEAPLQKPTGDDLSAPTLVEGRSTAPDPKSDAPRGSRLWPRVGLAAVTLSALGITAFAASVAFEAERPPGPPPMPPVAAAPGQPAQAAPEPAPPPQPAPEPPAVPQARLRLTGLPRSAQVKLDGAPLAAPGAENTLAPGPHVLTVEARGYQRQERTVRLLAGELTTLKVELKRARRR